uniref:Uncharacterized protein n=1 Tax=Meloidogyne hapla TaxID=6305 RepID=A0A1I8BA84_MELHA
MKPDHLKDPEKIKEIQEKLEALAFEEIENNFLTSSQEEIKKAISLSPKLKQKKNRQNRKSILKNRKIFEELVKKQKELEDLQENEFNNSQQSTITTEDNLFCCDENVEDLNEKNYKNEDYLCDEDFSLYDD